MLNPEHIQIIARDDPVTGNKEVCARLVIRAETWLDPSILWQHQSLSWLIGKAAERVVREVWRLVYGDIQTDLLKLHDRILRESCFSTETAEECSKIISKLDMKMPNFSEPLETGPIHGAPPSSVENREPQDDNWARRIIRQWNTGHGRNNSSQNRRAIHPPT